MRDNGYDAIVVGSGIAGGWAAKELTERGLRTLVLEAGRPITPSVDYTMHVQPWELRFRGLGDRAFRDNSQPIQSRCYAYDEWTRQFFVNDREHPYSVVPGTRFDWIRGRQVGGRSITWGRQVYRMSELDLEANARDGFGIDWPIRYADLAPWYDHVERFIGVSGTAEGLSHLPDGQFQPGMPLNVVERSARERLRQRYGRERLLTIGRCAVLTQALGARAACGYCGVCMRGCSTFSYFNSVHSTLPAAATTGRLILRPFSVVHSVIFDRPTGKAAGVRVIDAQTHKAIEFKSRVVFLCASALESTRILLNSRDAHWSTGLGNSSGALGKYLMDHWMNVTVEGTVPGFENRTTVGRRPTGFYVPRFRNVTSPSKEFLRGYAFQGLCGREGWERGEEIRGFGPELKAALRQPGPWYMRLFGIGECLPRASNYVELDPTLKDAWGIPALRIRATFGANEHAAMEDAATEGSEMLAVAGARRIEFSISERAPGLSVHEMGTARMGRSPKSSVLNGWNQSWDVPNLFVTDGACMTSSACQNPSLTYMALTARAVAYAVECMKRREL